MKANIPQRDSNTKKDNPVTSDVGDRKISTTVRTTNVTDILKARLLSGEKKTANVKLQAPLAVVTDAAKTQAIKQTPVSAAVFSVGKDPNALNSNKEEAQVVVASRSTEVMKRYPVESFFNQKISLESDLKNAQQSDNTPASSRLDAMSGVKLDSAGISKGKGILKILKKEATTSTSTIGQNTTSEPIKETKPEVTVGVKVPAANTMEIKLVDTGLKSIREEEELMIKASSLISEKYVAGATSKAKKVSNSKESSTALTNMTVFDSRLSTAGPGGNAIDGGEGMALGTKVVKLMKREPERALKDGTSISAVVTVDMKPLAVHPKEPIDSETATSDEAMMQRIQSRLSKLVKPKPKDVTMLDLEKQSMVDTSIGVAPVDKASKLLSVLRAPAHIVPPVDQSIQHSSPLPQQAAQPTGPKDPIPLSTKKTVPIVPSTGPQAQTTQATGLRGPIPLVAQKSIVPAAVLLRKQIVKKAA